MNVFSRVFHATQQAFSGDAANADPSQGLRQRWAHASSSEVCGLIDDRGVFALLRAMRDNPDMRERHCPELAQYLMGSRDRPPRDLCRLSQGDVAVADESKALLGPLLKSGWTEAPDKTQDKLETLLDLMERLEVTRGRHWGREPHVENGVGNGHADVGAPSEVGSHDDSKDAGEDIHSHRSDESVVDICFRSFGAGSRDTLSRSRDKNSNALEKRSSGPGWWGKREVPPSTDDVSEARDDGAGIQEQTSVVEKVLVHAKKVAPFDALACGDLRTLGKALANPSLSQDRVYELLTPKDEDTRPALRRLIGAPTQNADELTRKRAAFGAYVALLKEHAPRLTAGHLKGLYEYLHISHTVRGDFWNSNSPGYVQLMKDKPLYQAFKDLKTVFKNASLPGSSLPDKVFAEMSREIQSIGVQQTAPALSAERRLALLMYPTEGAPSILRRLLTQPATSAFSVVHKRTVLREYLALLHAFTPALDVAQRKRLYRHLLDSQQVAAGWLGKANSEGYQQVMKDTALRQDYKMLKRHLAGGGVMQDSDAGRRFVKDMRLFQDSRTPFAEAWAAQQAYVEKAASHSG